MGITLCIRTVVPALFPFFILSVILSNSLLGTKSTFLEKICKLPKGAASLLLVGLLSGYPVGAQLVAQAYADGNLSRKAAQRMLGFCSNAGPAFLFGMLAAQFEKWYIPWLLWSIHICGALLAGIILPSDTRDTCKIQSVSRINLTTAINHSIRSICTVCAWVILFRMIISFCQSWFFWRFPIFIQVLFSGILELSNGCVMLHKIPSEGLRFILAGFFLSFGGICVLMQTRSVTGNLGLGRYFPGKLIQCVFTVICCCLLQYMIY